MVNPRPRERCKALLSTRAGGGVPEASITLRQLSSSAARTLTTGDTGQFQAAGVPIGSYSLHVEKSGFNPVNVESLTISVGQTVTQRITMSPASVSTRLDVQEQADLLQSSATTANVALGGERDRGRTRVEQELSKLCAGGSGCIGLCRNQHQPVDGGP